MLQSLEPVHRVASGSVEQPLRVKIGFLMILLGSTDLQCEMCIVGFAEEQDSAVCWGVTVWGLFWLATLHT